MIECSGLHGQDVSDRAQAAAGTPGLRRTAEPERHLGSSESNADRCATAMRPCACGRPSSRSTSWPRSSASRSTSSQPSSAWQSTSSSRSTSSQPSSASRSTSWPRSSASRSTSSQPSSASQSTSSSRSTSSQPSSASRSTSWRRSSASRSTSSQPSSASQSTSSAVDFLASPSVGLLRSCLLLGAGLLRSRLLLCRRLLPGARGTGAPRGTGRRTSRRRNGDRALSFCALGRLADRGFAKCFGVRCRFVPRAGAGRIGRLAGPAPILLGHV